MSEWVTIALELGGRISFGFEREDRASIRFSIREWEESGYNHLLFLTEADMDRLIEALQNTRRQPFESMAAIAAEGI